MHIFPETLPLEADANDSQWRPQLELAWAAARAAGELITDARENDDLSFDRKDHMELVTSADIAADELIVKMILGRFSDHVILSEETHNDLATITDLDAPTWIIDPIDGTVNYAYGHFQSAVSIGFAEGGRLRAAVVYAPFLREVFYACEKGGAYLLRRGLDNELVHQRIAVSEQTELSRSLIATGFPYDQRNIGPMMRRLSAVAIQCGGLRRLGSAALDICWVACGRFDAYYESIKPWDYAAGLLILTEAGGRSGFHSPPPEGRCELLHGDDRLVSTPALFDELKALLEQA
ncbi:inositol monophosphatase family protein [Allohahella marinimesophila]|uniref:Inositol-1-monophosphatase n=1 Tax=Allohahella marinimesophila TaxID=1054972 RepID=A0ABP7P4J7_9GAMM